MSTEEIQARLRELSQLSSLSTDVLATCRISMPSASTLESLNAADAWFFYS